MYIKPDVMLHVEIRDKIYIYSVDDSRDRAVCQSERMVRLCFFLSGGIDSPVAGYMISQSAV